MSLDINETSSSTSSTLTPILHFNSTVPIGWSLKEWHKTKITFTNTCFFKKFFIISFGNIIIYIICTKKDWKWTSYDFFPTPSVFIHPVYNIRVPLIPWNIKILSDEELKKTRGGLSDRWLAISWSKNWNSSVTKRKGNVTLHAWYDIKVKTLRLPNVFEINEDLVRQRFISRSYTCHEKDKCFHSKPATWYNNARTPTFVASIRTPAGNVTNFREIIGKLLEPSRIVVILGASSKSRKILWIETGL